MFHLAVSKEQVIRANNFVTNNYSADSFKSGSPSKRGSRRKKVVGQIGEFVIGDILEIPLNLQHGWDDGFDIQIHGIKLDIKTMERHTFPGVQGFINNLSAKQVTPKHEAKGYIFCSLHSDRMVMTICGLFQRKFLRPEWLIPSGTVRHRGAHPFTLEEDTFEIPMDEVVRCNDPKGLISDVKFYFGLDK